MSKPNVGRAPVTVRLSPELMERMREAARKNGRQLGAELELAIEQYLDGNSDSQLSPELRRLIDDYLQRHGAR